MTSASTLTQGANGGDAIRVLLLEDNGADAELVTRRLEKDGLDCKVRVVSSEMDFRREITVFFPQIILSDFSLPQFDGLSALRVAQELAATIPFVFVSGTIGEERATEALKRGASDYVLKENLTRLVPAVRNALHQAEIIKARDLAEQMLRRSESRLQDIVNTSADWIWECDISGKFTFSNPRVEEVLGYGWHDLLGRSCYDYVDAPDKVALEAAFSDLLASEAVDAAVTLRWIHGSGERRWLERKMVVLRDDDGIARGYRGIDRDVTERVVQQNRIVRLNRALRFLSGANSAIVRLKDRAKLLKEACRLAVQIGGYGMATIFLRAKRDSQDEPFVCRAVGHKRSALERPKSEPLEGDGSVARALANAEPVIVDDLNEAGIPQRDRELLLAMGLRSCIALPLVLDGTAIGAIQLHSEETNVFGEAELALLRQVTGNITFSLQFMESKESAQYLEYFDTLTALAKRTLFLHRLNTMIRGLQQGGHGLFLLVIDIAGLTVINDGLGHHAGDLLLQLVAERLKNTFGDSNCLCHLGGGRYAIAANVGGDAASAETVLRESVEYLFEKPFMINDQELRISITAGLSHYPGDGDDAEALVQYAETALERAKAAGEQYLRHNPDMTAEATQRLSITNRLRQAVAENQFVLHYQPVVGVQSRRVEGVEALLRWSQSPDGQISPAVFVPMLESLGLIDDVGRWVIAQALSESTEYFALGGDGFKVAVNVSPHQLRHEEFVGDVLRVLDEVPHAGFQLVLEVTESMLMADPHRASEMLKRLRAAGVLVSIDDFGTGHSSLKILSRLPVDTLKIDRGFVRDLLTSRSDRLIVQTTISLAKSLGMRTVAEGVETQEQVDLLSELGVDVLQGYFIHRPAPAPEIRQWLKTGNGHPSPEGQGGK